MITSMPSSALGKTAYEKPMHPIAWLRSPRVYRLPTSMPSAVGWLHKRYPTWLALQPPTLQNCPCRAAALHHEAEHETQRAGAPDLHPRHSCDPHWPPVH